LSGNDFLDIYCPFFARSRAVIAGGENRRTPDASYHQHLEPRDRAVMDRVVTTGPAVSSPSIPNFFR